MGGEGRTAPSSMRTARLPWDVVTRELSAVCSLWVSNLVGTPDRLKVILPSTSDSTVPSATADGWWRTVVMASGPMEPASSGAIDLIAAAQDSAAMALPPSLAPSLAPCLRGHAGTHSRRRIPAAVRPLPV